MRPQLATSAQSSKLESPACERNKGVILEVLREKLATTPSGLVLELASGTGQHIAHFAPALPQLMWQPTNLTPDTFASITAWAAGIPNVCFPPLLLDARKDTWPLSAERHLAAIYVANLTHISPYEATQGMLHGAGKYLKPGGFLIVYGPFKSQAQGRPDGHTSDSNAAFDAELKARDPTWGYRYIEEVEQEAAAQTEGRLKLQEVRPMPATNFILVFRLSEGGG